MLQTLVSVPRPQALAKALNEHWDLPRPAATLIKHSLALTYRIDTDRGAFACRLSDGHGLNAEALAQAHADLVAAGAPLPACERTRTGGLTATLACPEGPRTAVLTHWIDGEPLSQNRTIDHAALFGQALAEFHRAGAAVEQSPAASDFHHGLEAARLAPICLDLDTHRLQVALDRVAQGVSKLATAAEPRTIVHGDLDSSNAIVTDSGIRLLDIECLATGPQSLDLAAFTTETRHWPWPNQARIRDAFIDAYGGAFGHHRQVLPNEKNKAEKDKAWPLLEAARLAQILARHLDLRQRHGVDRLSPGFTKRLIGKILVYSESDDIPVSH